MASYLWLWSSTKLTRPGKPSVVDNISCSSIVWIVYRLHALLGLFFFGGGGERVGAEVAATKWFSIRFAPPFVKTSYKRTSTALKRHKGHKCEFLGVLAAYVFLCFLHHLILEQTKHFTGPDSLAAVHCFAIRCSVATICFSGFLIIDGRVSL